MRKNRVDVFEITEKDDVAFAAKEIATESDVEFQLELLSEFHSLRDAMDQLAQVQLDLTQMMQAFQARVDQKLDEIAEHLEEAENGSRNELVETFLN